jgi:hypothetical protein
MSPENCKALLEAGILQAYAEGKQIQLFDDENSWFTICVPTNFIHSPSRYRIKPEHTFKVGDLVRLPHQTIPYKITQILKDTCRAERVNDKIYHVFKLSDIIKVKEVLTPFTFIQAVRAVAEHGTVISKGEHKYIIKELNERTLDVDYQNNLLRGYRIPYKELLDENYNFNNPNIPCYNVTYEEIK